MTARPTIGPMLLATITLAAACRQKAETAPDAASSSPPSVASSASASVTTPPTPPTAPTTAPFVPVTGSFDPPKLHKITCPYEAPEKLANPPEGCKNCKKGEYCARFNSHGREYGGCTTNQCTKDTECPGEMCVCGPPNACWPGNCRDEKDCGGRECASTRLGSSRTSGSFCRTKDDTCSLDAHCGTDGECAYVKGAFTCRKRVPIPPG